MFLELIIATGSFLDNVKFIYGDSETRATSQSQDAGVSTKYHADCLLLDVETLLFVIVSLPGNGAGSHLYVNQGKRFNIDGCKWL